MQQQQAQAPPTGIEGIISSPIFQLAAPTALTALAAMFPRTMGPAASIGMAGLRGVTDVTQQGIQNKRSTVAERLKQMKADFEAKKLGYSLDNSGDLDPGQKQAARDLINAGDLQGAAQMSAMASTDAAQRAQADRRVEAPIPAGVKSMQINAPGVQYAKDNTAAKPPGSSPFTAALDDLAIAYPRQPNESDSQWGVRLIGMKQQQELDKATKMQPITHPVDPDKEAKRATHDKGIQYAAEALYSKDPKRIFDITKMGSLRGGQNDRMAIFTAAEDLARANGEHFDVQGAQRAIKVMDDVYTGKGKQQILSFNTSMRHMAGFTKALKQLDGLLTDTPYYNKGLGWVIENLQGDPRYSRALAALDAPLKEVQTFLLNNRALYQDDREMAHQAANLGMPVESLQAVINEWGHIAAARLGEINYAYENVVGEPVKGLLSPQALQAAKDIGLDMHEFERGEQGPGGSSGPYPPNRKIRLPDGRVVNTDANGNAPQ
jgi:hypothetical protein